MEIGIERGLYNIPTEIMINIGRDSPREYRVTYSGRVKKRASLDSQRGGDVCPYV